MAIYPDKKNGKLTGRFRVEVQKDGKRARGRFNTLQEAREAEEAWKRDISTAPTQKKRNDSRGVPETMQQLMVKSYGSLFEGLKTEVQSYARLRSAIQIMGNPLLSDVTTLSIDALIKTLRNGGGGAPKSPSTINRYLSAVHSLLRWGSDRGYVTGVPKFPWQVERSHRLRWITQDEEHKLLQLLRSYGRPDLADLVYVAIRTGMRRGELLGLEKRDVDSNWIRLWETKTDTPRSVPVNDDIRSKVLKLIEKGMPSTHDLRYWWHRARVDMGLENDSDFVFHACRHTCATRLVQANVHIRVIQRYLGHKRIETTMRYAQVNEGMLTEALAQLEQPDVREDSHWDVARMRKIQASPTVLSKPLKATDDNNVVSLDAARKRAFTQNFQAGVVELVDTQDLGSE